MFGFLGILVYTKNTTNSFRAKVSAVEFGLENPIG